MAKSSSAERYRLRDAFMAARAALQAASSPAKLDRALAYWALPADRRLPVALLDRSLRDIVETPFERLAATPGIGQKKLGMLVLLMHRAQVDDGVEEAPAVPPGRGDDGPVLPDDTSLLDPDTISETQWNLWCNTAQLHDLGREKLGRLAPSLQDLPTVIWESTLSDYYQLSLGEVRRLKTHGEKRVRVVLDVFRILHQLLGNVGRNSGLCVRLVPRFVPTLEDWFYETLSRSSPLDWHELRDNLVLPLLNQLAVDAGPLVQKLAEGRLGVEGTAEPVRVLAQRVGVTRARVYQLLETCQRVMAVRWPEGRLRFDVLALHLESTPADHEARQLYQAARDLFFPHRDSAAASTTTVASTEPDAAVLSQLATVAELASAGRATGGRASGTATNSGAATVRSSAQELNAARNKVAAASTPSDGAE